jgi:3-dehydroquinate synthase
VNAGGIPGAVMYELHGSTVALGPSIEGTGGDAIRTAIGDRRGVLISDSNVMPLYGHQLADRVGIDPADRFPFSAGEGNKNRIEWSRLTNAMLNRGIGRDAIVIAVGGGVTGDLAGFVAATYMRGIPFIQVPTTLVGAFHHPELVLIDPSTLRTLPQREYRAGLAEALKHSLVDSVDHFDWLRSNVSAIAGLDAEALAQLLRRSLSVKHRVVLADERESGVRKTLNAGHTIGHAVESVSEFDLLHGECVATGLVVEARISVALGIAKPDLVEKIVIAAESLSLPTKVPAPIGTDAIIAATKTDKKARAGAVEYALLNDVGHVASAQSGYATAVPEDVVREAIEASR